MFEIEINGKAVKVRFGMHLLEKLLSCDPVRLQNQYYFLSCLIFYGHENYCMGYDLAPLVDKGEVFSYLEDNTGNNGLAEALVAMLKVYADSQPAKMVDEANKKKAAEIMTSQPLEDMPLALSD